MYSAIGLTKINDNNKPRYIFNGIDTIKIFILGISFDVKPRRTSVINNTPKIGRAMLKPILNIWLVTVIILPKNSCEKTTFCKFVCNSSYQRQKVRVIREIRGAK